MHKRTWLLIYALIIVGIGALVFSIVWQNNDAAGVLTHYSLKTLGEEASTMGECAECHESEKFHTCDTCHDDHGAVEMENVPFYGVVSFVGDVTEPGYLLLDDVLPYHDFPHTHLPLREFLAQQGVTEFESVTLTSLDGGFVTIQAAQLTDAGLLMPYIDGIRFAAEDLHISAWIKGIRGIIVVGNATPLRIEGQLTSIGRLLLGPTQFVTVNMTDVMFKNEDDGAVRKAGVGTRIEGVPLSTLIAMSDFTQVNIRDANGETYTLTAEEVSGAVLTQLRGQVTLVLPERGSTQWVKEVVEIQSSK